METILKYWYVWGAVLLIGGFFIGKNWDSWFPATADDRMSGEKSFCQSLDGSPCCRPKRIRFNSESNQAECS